MAANEETVSIDTVKKTLWDSLEALGENISGETLSSLMEIIEGGGSGGGGVVYVPFSVTKDAQTDEFVVTTTTSFATITEALSDGKVLIGKADVFGETVFFLSFSCAIPSAESPGMVAFSGVTDTAPLDEEPDPSMMTIWMGDNGNCRVTMVSLTAK